jgi:hypothetical protein
VNATRRFAEWCASKDIHELTQVQPFHVAAFVHLQDELSPPLGAFTRRLPTYSTIIITNGSPVRVHEIAFLLRFRVDGRKGSTP